MAKCNEEVKEDRVICPEGHSIHYTRDNVARAFDGGQDAMTLQPTFEVGFFCIACKKPYGLSELKENPGK